jgi:hypothetical protein
MNFCVYKGTPPGHIMTRTHNLFSSLSEIHFNIILQSTLGLFPSSFQPKILFEFPTSSMRAACPAHLIVYLIFIVFCKGYKLRSFSLCRFIRSPITAFLFIPNIVLCTLFLNSLRCYYSGIYDSVKFII